MNIETDHHSTRHLGHHSAASTRRSPPLCALRESSTPKLGDFAKLQSSLLQRRPTTPESSTAGLNTRHGSSPDSAKTPSVQPSMLETPTSLGNFAKVFNQLRPSATTCPTGEDSSSVKVLDGRQVPTSLSESPLYLRTTQPELRSGCPGVLGVGSGHRSSPQQDEREAGADALEATFVSRLKTSLDLDLDSDFELTVGLDAGIITPTTTPPTSLEWCPSPLTIDIPKKHSPLKNDVRQIAPNTASQPQYPSSTLRHLFSYQLVKHGPFVPVYDHLRTRNKTHESLSLKLISIRAEDALVTTRHPAATSNGIHVFLDMSNINISFHKALRKKYAINDRARFAPLPPLSLEFLTEILVRNRKTATLHAGCSVHPDRHEPRYIHELRALGYRVDLRERKAVSSAQVAPYSKSSGSSSDEISRKRQSNVRYVEDLVDETLQTRIAESVMKCFQSQGTIVLATGDAQPAKYSDGFFAYAERALKMGWNVEVISWKSSLSSNWKDHSWSGQWGDRFRIIQLDDFVDHLLACYL